MVIAVPEAVSPIEVEVSTSCPMLLLLSSLSFPVAVPQSSDGYESDTESSSASADEGKEERDGWSEERPGWRGRGRDGRGREHEGKKRVSRGKRGTSSLSDVPLEVEERERRVGSDRDHDGRQSWTESDQLQRDRDLEGGRRGRWELNERYEPPGEKEREEVKEKGERYQQLTRRTRDLQGSSEKSSVTADSESVTCGRGEEERRAGGEGNGETLTDSNTHSESMGGERKGEGEIGSEEQGKEGQCEEGRGEEGSDDTDEGSGEAYTFTLALVSRRSRLRAGESPQVSTTQGLDSHPPPPPPHSPPQEPDIAGEV